MEPDDYTLPELRTIDLEWMQYAAQQTVSRELLLNTELRTHHEMIYDALVVQLRKSVLVDTFARDSYTAELVLPATWWQQWKQEHGRKWLGPLIMQRWPVKTTTRTAVVEVKRCLTYPEAKLQRDPGGLGVVRILEQTRGPYWRPER